jgi:hypothetical protein
MTGVRGGDRKSYRYKKKQARPIFRNFGMHRGGLHHDCDAQGSFRIRVQAVTFKLSTSGDFS